MASRGQGGDDAFFAAAAEAAREHGKIIPADDHITSDEKGTDDFADETYAHETPEGLIAPTNEELETLRHVSDYINWSTYCAWECIYMCSLCDLTPWRSDCFR